MLFAGWGLKTVNMPATHAIVCGSVLNKTVSCADENWGTRWEELAESLRVYALGEVKHGWLLWVTVLGCLLRDLFPDPESALYKTGATQAEFVQGLSTLILEFLVGTKLHLDALSRAQTREDLLCSLRYRRTNGDLSERPPTRVELLTEIRSPWSSISYEGSRFLQVAQAETVRKFWAIHDYFVKYSAKNLAESILKVDISQDQEDYVLFNLMMEQQVPAPGTMCSSSPLWLG